MTTGSLAKSKQMLQSKQPLESSASDMEFGMVFNSWEKQCSNAMNQGTGSHK